MKTQGELPGPALTLGFPGAQMLLASLGVILTIIPLHADPLDRWEMRHPSPAGQAYFYGDEQWIGLRGVGGILGSGEITHSTDTYSWSRSLLPSDFVPMGAAYANGLWVVSGQEGTNGVNLFSAILTSTNGMVWEKQTSGLDLLRSLNIDPQIFDRVAYGGGLWMAMGSAGRYLTSVDGVTWTPRAIAGVFQIDSLSYGNGRWLALASDGFSYGEAYISTNGTTWTSHTIPLGITRATFGAEQWSTIASSISTKSVMTSTNGTDWTPQYVIPESEMYQRIAYGDERWLAAGTMDDPRPGENGLVTLASTNGISWERPAISAPSFERFDIRSLAHGNGLWLLNDIDDLLASTDGINWTSRTERATAGSFTDLAHAAGQWTAVGEPFDPENNPGFVIATSLDGRRWTNGYASGNGSLSAVAYGEGKWMAAGVRYDPPNPNSAVILASTNGFDWISTLTNIFPGSRFGGIAFGSGLWVAAGSDPSGPFLITSPDGLTWTPRALPVAEGGLGQVRFANGRWVVLGIRSNQSPIQPFILTSTNGVDWSLAAGVAGNVVFDASDAHFANGLWIVLSYRSHPDGFFRPTTLRSTNGTDWIVHDLDTDFDLNARLTAITHAAGRWIIAGRIHRYGLDNAAVWSSGDGGQWTEHLAGSGLFFSSAASDGRHLLMVSGDVIRASGRLTPALPPVLALTRQGAELSLWLNGEIGEQYELEQTVNLAPADWFFVQSVTLTNASQRILSNLPTGDRKFWRARTP